MREELKAEAWKGGNETGGNAGTKETGQEVLGS
jgi:hypothetical protein